MNAALTLVVLAKRPEPGLVKTRLCPPLSPVQAADVAAAALAATMDTVDRTRVTKRRLCFAGDSDGWARVGWDVQPQCAGGLDARIADAFAGLAGPAVLIGMDTPQVRTDQLAAFDHERFDTCFGRTFDGGYWAIGFRDPRTAALAVPGVPMSTEHTGRDQLRRLQALGLSVQLLDPLRDVDTIEDAYAVANLMPGSGFATVLARADRRSA